MHELHLAMCMILPPLKLFRNATTVPVHLLQLLMRLAFLFLPHFLFLPIASRPLLTYADLVSTTQLSLDMQSPAQQPASSVDALCGVSQICGGVCCR